MSLTDGDLKDIKNLFKITLDEDDTLVRRGDIKHLPNKDEFYEQTLKVLDKLDKIEESMEIISARQSEDGDRIEALEKIHPHGVHSVSV